MPGGKRASSARRPLRLAEDGRRRGEDEPPDAGSPSVNFIPIDPCQAVIMALRSAMLEGIPRAYVDRDVATFEARNPEETVPYAHEDIWAVLTDPDLLARLSPLVTRIDDQGEHWVWHLTGISALGVRIDPCFRERMSFVDGHKIGFQHDPPPDRHERAGAAGNYLLEETGDGTHLPIDLTIHVELPLPRTAAPTVRRVMDQIMQRTGDRFARNRRTERRGRAASGSAQAGRSPQERALQGTLDASRGVRAPGDAYECSRGDTVREFTRGSGPRETSKSCSTTIAAPLDGPCFAAPPAWDCSASTAR